MRKHYYKPCELDRYNSLLVKYFYNRGYDKCFNKQLANPLTKYINSYLNLNKLGYKYAD